MLNACARGLEKLLPLLWQQRKLIFTARCRLADIAGGGSMARDLRQKLQTFITPDHPAVAMADEHRGLFDDAGGLVSADGDSKKVSTHASQ